LDWVFRGWVESKHKLGVHSELFVAISHVFVLPVTEFCFEILEDFRVPVELEVSEYFDGVFKEDPEDSAVSLTKFFIA